MTAVQEGLAGLEYDLSHHLQSVSGTGPSTAVGTSSLIYTAGSSSRNVRMARWASMGGPGRRLRMIRDFRFELLTCSNVNIANDLSCQNDVRRVKKYFKR